MAYFGFEPLISLFTHIVIKTYMAEMIHKISEYLITHLTSDLDDNLNQDIC